MDSGDERGVNPPEAGRQGRKWKTAERLLASLAALIAVIGGAVVAVKWVTQDKPVEKEQRLVEQLRPGQTLERAIEIIGDKPHYSEGLRSGNRLYQYNRKWERVQLLVDPDNISVLSVGIFADNTDFRPSFRLGGAHLTINRTPYAEAPGEPPAFVFGGCGAHSGDYFEGRPDLALAAGGGSIAVGIHDSHRGSVTMDPVCAALQAVPKGCVPGSFEEVDPSPGMGTECLTSAPAGAFRKATAVAAAIITKQVELTQDMFHSPYVLAGGND
ncbi:hypothetical protein EJC51_46400 [Streptomyces aquilus]|uniref:Uncharacterized protein n=1 Tax=Streptomyces aquilus TaxID=2548456 RepID=A0A3Q9C6F3_9ACTN|nr:hypothetical protein [Streptomyces aquilus]AZP22824.1 hypothetical protein EJC51_46400 [Streptomyces aquilus]